MESRDVGDGDAFRREQVEGKQIFDNLNLEDCVPLQCSPKT
jgi:hypothetical protein